jgi:hypothetical protein
MQKSRVAMLKPIVVVKPVVVVKPKPTNELLAMLPPLPLPHLPQNVEAPVYVRDNRHLPRWILI